MARPRTSPQPEVPGLTARKIAADILDGVLRRKIALDEQLSGKVAHPGLAALADRDRALMRRLVATALRRLGTLRHLLGGYLDKGFPADAPRTETILLIGAVQILWLDVPDHAAVDLSVRLAQADRRAARYAGLVNAVLRRVAQNRAALAATESTRDTPSWLLARWRKTYGNDTARAIALANGHEPALDLTVKDNADTWAERLHGRVLPTGSVRTLAQGAISLLPGFNEGAWWVQDAAASLPARLLGDVRGLSVADLCAAPGGKTAQLALCRRARHRGRPLAGAPQSAARQSRALVAASRVRRRRRAGVATQLVKCGAVRRRAARRALLLDRHHPPPSRRALAQGRGRHRDARRAAAETARPRRRPAQARRRHGLLRLLARAGGRRRADRRPARRAPVSPASRSHAGEVAGRGEFLTADGDLRTLPLHLPDPDPRWGGLDGFYAARLVKTA